MSRDLLIAAGPGELRGLLAEDGRVCELRIVRDGEGGRIGDIHLGRVVKILPALPAALVEIGLDRPAFLSAEDAAGAAPDGKRDAGIAAWLTEGQSVLVQLTREAQGDKAVSVRIRPRLVGRLLTLTPMRPKIVTPRGADDDARQRATKAIEGRLAEGQGAILGKGALAVAPETLQAELAALQARWESLQQRAREATPPARLAGGVAGEMGLVGQLLDAFAALPPDRIVVDDRAALATARLALARQPRDPPPFLALHEGADDIFESYGVADDLAAALSARVALPGGGALIIETMAAMTAIDVDGGDAVTGRGDSRAALLGVNLAAAEASARQIRLRNLAGAIIIDFVSMERRGDRERVGAALERALADDPAAPQILGWTRLGHVELTRRRRHKPLAEIVFERASERTPVKSALTTALEALREAARQAAHFPGRAPTLIVHPAVAAALAGAAAAGTRQLEAALARRVTIVSDPARGRETFDIRYH
ncbi:MAG TPA: ribonuclease E/G [Stellaceae bacterium]|nr:ribonuclease E/G [Stellaceae bacterium]